MLSVLEDIAERVLFDPGFIDLVVWFPHLTWSEFAASLAVVSGWRWFKESIERAASKRLRRAAARLLVRVALRIRPQPVG